MVPVEGLVLEAASPAWRGTPTPESAVLRYTWGQIPLEKYSKKQVEDIQYFLIDNYLHLSRKINHPLVISSFKLQR